MSKPKPKVVAIAKLPPRERPVSELSIEEAVDELGRLEDKYAVPKSDEKRMKDLKVLFQSRADRDYKPAQAVSFQGTKYSAEVTAKQNRRYVKSLLAIFLAWGRDKYLRLSTLTLTAVEKNSDTSQIAEWIGEEQNTGDRKVRCVLRAVAAAKAA